MQGKLRDAVVHEAERAVEQVIVVVTHIQRLVLVKVLAVSHHVPDDIHAAASRLLEAPHQADVRIPCQFLQHLLQLRALALLKSPVCHLGAMLVCQNALQTCHIDIIHVKGHKQVVFRAPHPVQRQAVGHGTVHKHRVAPLNGPEQRRDGDGSPHGRKERAAVKDHLLARVQVGRHGAEGHVKVLNPHLGHNLPDGVNDALALHNVVLGDGQVHEREHLPCVQRVEPLLELRQLARRKDAPNERAH